MQRYSLLHDGTDLSRQAAYLAIHITARLGAPLLVLLVGSPGITNLKQADAEIRLAGRAAGIVLESIQTGGGSFQEAANAAADSDGLFLPRSLAPRAGEARAHLEAGGPPLWVIARPSELQTLAVLTLDPEADRLILGHAHRLATRMQKKLAGLVETARLAEAVRLEPGIEWTALDVVQPETVDQGITQTEAGLLFLSAVQTPLVYELQRNFVAYSPG